jgi:ATP-binding cassette subfamily B multidrug efflux pump
MLRLIKYLKPYSLLVVLAIILLFAQANFDLALPDYFSRIVNVGIQQGGVENTVPRAIRQSQMEKIFIFVSAEERSRLLNSYTLVDISSPEYEETLKDYPALENEPVYVLNDIADDVMDSINPIMAKGLLVVTGIEMIRTNPDAASQMDFGAFAEFDFSKIPPGMDIFDVISHLPESQRTQLLDLMNQRFIQLGESAILQAATQAVKAEYEALGVNTARLQTEYILGIGGVMLLLTLLSGICIIIVGYSAARTSAGFARDIRSAVFRKVEGFSLSEINSFSTASLITRTTNDITQVQMVVMMMVRMVFFAPIMGVGGIIRALGKGGSMWWLIAGAVAILLILILLVMSTAIPRFKMIQNLIDRINLVARENLSGMLVIRAFNRQDYEEERFDKANIALTDVSRFINRLMVIMGPFMMLIMNGLSMAIIWVGAHQIAEARMQVGDMIAFTQYAMQIVMSFLMLTMMFIFLPRAAVSGERIADVLETSFVIEDPVQPLRLPDKIEGKIEFKDVSFRYPGALDNVLHDINFTAQPGKTTGLIGSTGCGKSTLVNLIPRFYDVTAGAVLMDGMDIRQMTQQDLRSQIGYIPQAGTLFSGTIASNIAYGDEDASDEKLMEAVRIAQAADFVLESEDGLDAGIAQGGDNVSGGQKQRLSIARALVKNPPIYIFDDSFSALDFRTDYALRKALKKNTVDSTILIVTQRVSTIKDADQIIVLDEGVVVGKGTHQELMENCETYREIALSQLSLEELV